MAAWDLVFIVCFLAAVVVLISIASAAIAGKLSLVIHRLRRLGIGAAIYMVVILIAGIASPRRVYRVGDNQCFDDWCIEVTRAARERPDSMVVTLRLSSRARRVPQGEKGTVVYLTDSRQRRYDPAPDPHEVSFSTLLQPGEAVETERRFAVLSDARELGLIYTHEGGFPISFFIGGENGRWIYGPSIVRLE